jgi:nicotinate-nucleotide pyrophosphorylase (carboxylating)
VIAPPTLERIVALALEEDFGRGDITTAACVDREAAGQAVMRAREPLVVCGVDVARAVFRQVDPELRFEPRLQDGARAGRGAEIVALSGRASSILHGERVALNFMQRLSAVATKTRACVDALPEGGKTRITDTRKTTPGLRALERYAVRCGGGHNHREDLAAAILIKDNHVAASGGVRSAIQRAKAYAPHTSRILCEVDSLPQLQEALDAGADAIMLDNFDDDAVARAVALVNGRAILEVSGGVDKQRIPALAKLGVDVISVGALTHSAGSVDLGLDWT